MYLHKIPKWIQLLYPKRIWRIDESEKKIYLSFDDGPNPITTIPILKILKKYNVLAHFFCVGDNVLKYPNIFQEIKKEGHIIGNHTFNHLNGWKTTLKDYLDDVEKADEIIQSTFFRPPYGRLTTGQAKALNQKYKIIMFDVIPGDFDKNIDSDLCIERIKKTSEKGSIIVLHDNLKTWDKTQFILPSIIEYFLSIDYEFDLFKK